MCASVCRSISFYMCFHCLCVCVCVCVCVCACVCVCVMSCAHVCLCTGKSSLPVTNNHTSHSRVPHILDCFLPLQPIGTSLHHLTSLQSLPRSAHCCNPCLVIASTSLHHLTSLQSLPHSAHCCNPCRAIASVSLHHLTSFLFRHTAHIAATHS